MKYESISTQQEAEALLAQLQRHPGPVGIDCETIGIDPTKESPCGTGRIHCWSLAVSGPDSRFIEHLGSTIRNAESYFIPRRLLPVFAEYLRTAPVVGHNVWSFDRHIFHNEGVPLENIVGDTLRMHRLLHPSTEMAHGLKPLARNWLGFKQPSFDSIVKRPEHRMDVEPKDRITKRKVGEVKGVPTVVVAGPVGKFVKRMEYIPLDELEACYPRRWDTFVKYAALDAGLALELYQCFRIKLQETRWTLLN